MPQPDKPAAAAQLAPGQALYDILRRVFMGIGMYAKPWQQLAPPERTQWEAIEEEVLEATGQHNERQWQQSVRLEVTKACLQMHALDETAIMRLSHLVLTGEPMPKATP